MWTNEVENLTTNIAIPTEWIYTSDPGSYFWNGLAFVFVLGIVCLAGRWMRRITVGGGEGG